jgi:hypothetical protein
MGKTQQLKQLRIKKLYRLNHTLAYGVVVSLAGTHQTKNPFGFSKAGEKKQLHIAIVMEVIILISVLLFSLQTNSKTTRHC